MIFVLWPALWSSVRDRPRSEPDGLLNKTKGYCWTLTGTPVLDLAAVSLGASLDDRLPHGAPASRHVSRSNPAMNSLRKSQL